MQQMSRYWTTTIFQGIVFALLKLHIQSNEFYTVVDKHVFVYLVTSLVEAV